MVDVIETARDGRVLEVTLDRPTRRNALTPAGLDELATAVSEATAPVVYLHGAGEAFCAGADLDVVADLADRDAAEAFARRGQQVADAIETAEATVIAGIDGATRGGGLDLALACDFRVATPAATFAASGIDHGLLGAWGGTVRLPRTVGPTDAMDLACSGRVIDAAEARGIGLVSRVLTEPRSVADEVAEHDPVALQRIGERLRDTGDHETLEAREASAFADLHSRSSSETREQ